MDLDDAFFNRADNSTWFVYIFALYMDIYAVLCSNLRRVLVADGES